MVTSSAIALIAINDRVGRCTRLATTILFIICIAGCPTLLALSRERGDLTFRLRSHRVLQLSHSTRALSTEYWVPSTGLTSSPAASPGSTAAGPDVSPLLPTAAPTR